MDRPPSHVPAVAGVPRPRPPDAPRSAEVLRSLGLQALVELVEGSSHAVGIADEDGRWVHLNPAGCRLLGRSFDELRGTAVAPGSPPAGRRLPAGDGRLALVVLPQAAGGVAGPAEEALLRQAAEQERRRLGRDLHDSVSSALFALHTRTQVVDRALAAGDAALLAEAAQDMQALSGQAIAELRAMVSTMRQDAPDGPGADAGDGQDLPAALERLAATTRSRDGLDVELRLGPALPAVPPATAVHLARIASEAVHNCLKHAQACGVRVELEVRGSELVLAVTDEGRGFDPRTVPAGRHGQRTMRERAVLCGGWLHVETAPGRGTRVVARVPLPG